MNVCKKWMLFLLIFSVSSPLILSQEKNVRNYLTTGNWYSRYPENLNTMLETFFKETKIKPMPGKIVGLIGPHAGFAYSGQCMARAYKQLEKQPGPERVILLGISHRGGFYGAAVSDFQYNSTPLGKIPVDTEITAKLAEEKNFRKNNTIMQHEHSLENHLPFLQFIQNKLKNNKYKIVPILFGYLYHQDFKKMADIIKKYIDDKTLVIASTDLTHYGSNFGYTPFRDDLKSNLTKLDMGIINHIKKLDFDGYFNYKKKTGITMCGFTPVGVLMNLFAGKNYSGTLIDYYKSGDFENDYSFSVSYASMVITETPSKTAKANRGPGKPAPDKGEEPGTKAMKLTQKEKKTLLSIARQTLEEHFQGKRLELTSIESKYKISAPLKEKTGVFVTLRKNGDLRGCIGTLIGEEPVYEGVRNNVLKAAFQDPRFSPLKSSELKKIDMEISVMTPLQKIADYKKIKLGTDGVIIKKGYYQSVFLPQVATETGWGLDMFLSRLCMKAGLSPGAYKEEGMDFYIFQALVFDEKEVLGGDKK